MVAGLLGEQPRSAADHAVAERVMNTNYVAPALFLARSPIVWSAWGAGTIIGISSVAGDRGRASILHLPARPRRASPPSCRACATAWRPRACG